MNNPDLTRGKSLSAKLAEIPALGEFDINATQSFVIFEIRDQLFVRFGYGSHANTMIDFQEELDRKIIRYNAFDQALGQGFTEGGGDLLVLNIKICSGLFDPEDLTEMLSRHLSAESFLVKEG